MQQTLGFDRPAPLGSPKSVLNILDLFAGTKSSTAALEDLGHTVITVELNAEQEPTVVADVMNITADDLLSRFGRFDFIWASPPCTAFSVASLGHHWTGGHRAYIPKTKAALDSIDLVRHTRLLIESLSPRFGWIMENPRGLLRKLPVMEGLRRSTVTYCQYGDSRMKPTDLWGGIEGWLPDRRCRNGDTCHEAAPRGAKTGTQGIKGAAARARVPYALSADIAARLQQVADA
jgi:hypothetical protein